MEPKPGKLTIKRVSRTTWSVQCLERPGWACWNAFGGSHVEVLAFGALHAREKHGVRL